MGNLSATVAAQIAAANSNYNAQLAASRANLTALTSGKSAGSSPALASQATAVSNLKYQPIDIAALTKSAEEQAAHNVASSIGLEKQFSPGVAAARTGLQDQVAANLAQGGNLPADVQTRVARNVGAQAGASGLSASAGPITAASLGLTSLDLQRQRMADAGALLAQNQLPTAGLDPSHTTDLAVANNQQANQFALSKLGAQANLANSSIAAQQAQNEAATAANAPQPTYTFSAMPYQPTSYAPVTTYGLNGAPQQPGQLSYGQQLYNTQSQASITKAKAASRT